MWTRHFGFCFLFVIVTAVGSAAQSGNGAQHFDRDTLDAFASTERLFIGVFAERSETPLGVSGFAVVNMFDFSTGQFSQCLSANFDLVVNDGRHALSFATEGGFDCSAGQEIIVTCELTSDSGTFHNVTNGTAHVFGQRYTTHGQNASYNNLTCVLSAFGAESAARGSASTERVSGTP